MWLDRDTIAEQFAAKTAPNFDDPEVRAAILKGREEFRDRYMGREYPNILCGRHLFAGPSVGTYVSDNPNSISATIGRFQHYDPETMPLAGLLSEMRTHVRKHYETIRPEQMIEALCSIHELARDRFWLLVAAKQYETGQSLAEAYWETDEEVDFPLAHALDLQEFWNAVQVMPTADICGEFNGMRLVPHGVFATISPFNFPGAISMRMNTLALAGMNAIIEKSSDKSSLSGWLVTETIMDGLQRAGIDPTYLVGFMPGPEGVMADALLGSPDVAGFSFTGSSDVCDTIREKHGKLRRPGWGGKMRLAEGAVETSGVNIFVVWKDADPIAAARAYVMSFVGRSGQKCSSARVAMVHEAVFGAFQAEVERLLTDDIIYGNVLDLDHPAHLGAMISSRAVSGITQKIAMLGSMSVITSEFVKPADGRTFGYDFQPRVLYANRYLADQESPSADKQAHLLMNTELFGPASTIVPIRSLDQIERLVGFSEFALTGGVFTEDVAVLKRLLAIMPCGNLYVKRKCTGAFVKTEEFGALRSRSGSGVKGMPALALYASMQVISGNYPRSTATSKEVNDVMASAHFVLSKTRA